MAEPANSCPGCSQPMTSIDWDGTGWYRSEPCGCVGERERVPYLAEPVAPFIYGRKLNI